MATCAIAPLASSAFWNLDDHALHAAIAQLLCNISGAAAVTPQNYVGNGNPNGVVTAIAGSLYMDVSNPLNPVLWMKGSGTGNTGWE